MSDVVTELDTWLEIEATPLLRRARDEIVALRRTIRLSQDGTLIEQSAIEAREAGRVEGYEKGRLDGYDAGEREALAETPETIEAMAQAASYQFGNHWYDVQESERDEWRDAARHALAAIRKKKVVR